MRHVAKVLIADNQGFYLLLKRNNHPIFLNDPDLPGGTIEDGQDTVATALKEAAAEIGITLDPSKLTKVHEDLDVFGRFPAQVLYKAVLENRPEVKLGWQHSAFDWVDLPTLVHSAANARDTYMHMVYKVLGTGQ